MLPTQKFLWQFRQEGRRAGYEGALKCDCTYKAHDLKQAWEAGWLRGHQERLVDLQEGRHPSILYQKAQQVR